MSYLVFSRLSHCLELYSNQGNSLGWWEAYNNVAGTAVGVWPNGFYGFLYWKDHPESGINDGYGTKGIYIFHVPGRTGMGVHAGRKNSGGPKHVTMGCIRTTEEAMSMIEATHDGGDKLHHIELTEGVGDFNVGQNANVG